MRDRGLVLAGVALAVLSLGLPWSIVPGTPGYVTIGYYTAGYCDEYYCYGGTFQPGTYIPGTSGGSYPGYATDARFFVVAALVLALLGGWYLGGRALRWAAYVGVAGTALYLGYGLTGGIAAMAGAVVCWWLASRRVIRKEQASAPSV